MAMAALCGGRQVESKGHGPVADPAGKKGWPAIRHRTSWPAGRGHHDRPGGDSRDPPGRGTRDRPGGGSRDPPGKDFGNILARTGR